MQLLNDRVTRMKETLKHIHELQDMILNDPFEDLSKVIHSIFIHEQFFRFYKRLY